MEHKALPLHAHLASLPVYQPGRPLEEVARELGILLIESPNSHPMKIPWGHPPKQ